MSMEITPTTSSTTSTATSATGSSSGATLGKDQFLQLLVAQLSNQDPTNPLDDKAFVAQLAQFSSLEQAMATNDNLSALQLSSSAMVNAQLAGLVGKQVVVRSSDIQLPATGAAPDLALNLQGNAKDVKIQIVDSSGNLVRTLDAGALAAGAQSVAWDGCNASGSRLPPGSYRLTVVAKDQDGNTVNVDNEVKGIVSSIAFDSGSAELVLGSLRVKPSAVLSIENP
jgi:flagellar basal-body rod modification protein FlgD